MEAGKVPVEDYIITKSLTKSPDDYPDKRSLPHVQVHVHPHSGRPVLGLRCPIFSCTMHTGCPTNAEQRQACPGWRCHTLRHVQGTQKPQPLPLALLTEESPADQPNEPCWINSRYMCGQCIHQRWPSPPTCDRHSNSRPCRLAHCHLAWRLSVPSGGGSLRWVGGGW